MGQLIPFMVGPAALVVGIWVIISSRRGSAMAKSSRDWPTAPGTIISSGMSRTLDQRDTNFDQGPNFSNFRPKVEYTYTVEGHAYTGDKIVLGAYSTSRQDVSEMVSRYPAGAVIEVHYNPEDPWEATLDTSESRFAKLFMTAMGVFFAFIGAIVSIIEVLVLLART